MITPDPITHMTRWSMGVLCMVQVLSLDYIVLALGRTSRSPSVTMGGEICQEPYSSVLRAALYYAGHAGQETN